MGKKSRKKNNNNIIKPPKFDLSDDVKHSILGTVFIALGAIVLLSIFGIGGFVGEKLTSVFLVFFGYGTYLVPAICFLVAAIFLLSTRANIYFSNYIGAGLIFLSILGMLDLAEGQNHIGGYAGRLVAMPLFYLFGFWASFVILMAVFVAALSLCLNISFKMRKKNNGEKAKDAPVLDGESLQKKEKGAEKEKRRVQEEVRDAEEIAEKPLPAKARKAAAQENEFLPMRNGKSATMQHYALPPFSILEKERGAPSAGDIKAYANIIKHALNNFGINVEMGEINIGPTVTQYTLKPAQGVKLSRITALQSDLSLALAAHPIRIEAPIPGRSFVGIEIPNKVVAFVRLRNLLEEAIADNASPLLLTLGKDVSGRPICADLAKMPHLLIAGATGTGKSVAIHAIIVSLLFRNYPDLVKFLIIDPKRVELADYNNIPHLLTPVITEKEKAISALRWATREMEKRYQTLSEYGMRDIAAYNIAAEQSGESFMPYIIIIIDELADLMMAYPREVEGSIVRLAQMARAVGIHLIISTQRPSVEVITGLIKANIVPRIAFQVASQVDSRTILDVSGAEKLLGNGDMLFVSAEFMKPKRIQGAFITEGEIKRLVQYLKKSAKGEAVFDDALEQNIESEMSNAGNGSDDGMIDDDLYEEAKQEVIRMQKASASLLQRRLRVGYARAARLIDMLEENGVVGPGEGAKPRRILVREDGSPPIDSGEFGEESDEF